MSTAGPPSRGLGRGLGALIPTGATPLVGAAGLREVAVEAIRPNPRQPRTTFAPDALQELANSLRQHGVLQPLLVSRAADGGYQLIAGERRWRAAQAAGLATVPVLVKEAAPRANLELALVENIQRSDLNPLEEAHAFRELLDEHGLTQEQLARRLGKSRVTVANTLRLLQLPEPARQAVAEGRISEGHARAILGAPTEAARLAVLQRIERNDLTVRQAEALARGPHSTSAEDERALTHAAPDPDLARLEDQFRQALGTRVQLVRSGSGGRLIIHFFSEDELQGLYDTIVRA